MAALMSSVRPSSRVYDAFSKRWNPYSFSTGEFAWSAAAASALLVTELFSCHPPNWAGSASFAGLLGATGSAANAKAETEIREETTKLRIIFILRKTILRDIKDTT